MIACVAIAYAAFGYCVTTSGGQDDMPQATSDENLRAPADFVFRNGTIYTMKSPGDTVESLAVRGDRIVYAGPNVGLDEHLSASTRLIDLAGRTVLPGFTDAHVHLISGGITLLECDLSDVQNSDQLLSRLKAFADEHPTHPWIRGTKAPLPVLNNKPVRKLLDQIIPDRPVIVRSADFHNAWANSAALLEAGITADTPDPPNGRIERETDTREPDGTLRETAMKLIDRVIPRYTQDVRTDALREALKLANSLGITNVIAANVSDHDVQLYQRLAATGELSVHANCALMCDIATGTDCVESVVERNAAYQRLATQYDDLRFDQVKIFMDGVVEGKTAAMLEPYERESHRGMPNADEETAKRVIQQLDAAGLQIHIHAIGDLAVRMSLDALQHARDTNGVRDARHHLAHLHVVHPDDIPRFQTLDVAANFQALWASLDDSYVTQINLPYLGAKRAEWQYPIGTIGRAGGRLVFGSDWPVSTINPFHAIQVALTRRGPVPVAREPWTPQHLADRYTVIEGYTKGGAWLTFCDDDRGTLAVGKLADLVVVDRDPFNAPVEQLFETQVQLTMFRGRAVYSAEQDAMP
jgi:predicted amidohydrolase YtcJ